MRQFDAMFNLLSEPCVVIAPDHRFVRVNPASEHVLGWTADELCSLPWRRFVSERDAEQLAALVARLAFDAPVACRLRWRRASGERRLIEWEIVRPSGEEHCYAIGRDVTDEVRIRQALEQTNRKLALLASVDELTGLWNRRAFQRRLDEEILRAHRNDAPLSLVMIDIDHFKQYNDRHGHLVGDRTLAMFAGTIQTTIRRVDIAGRIGGEEFCILAPESDRTAALRLAERLRAAIHQQVWPREQVRASFGVATLDRFVRSASGIDPRQTATVLLNAADDALYQAKAAGRDRVAVAAESTAAGLNEGLSALL
ncbi:MAG: sensor domain-containing diguanylate cyclase [Candidatus Dadabacteria bacterium]|nr:MAG: sensor domain-containing diguanylate cyclase [Candidatus Dadabacteria bacterium]